MGLNWLKTQYDSLEKRVKKLEKGNSQRDSEIEKLNLELETVRGRMTDLELKIEELQKACFPFFRPLH